MVSLACASCARTSSLEVGTTLATLEAAAPSVDCVDPTALFADSFIPFLSVSGRESGALTERVLGVAAS